MTIRDNRDYIRALSYSYFTTRTGWGVLLVWVLSGSIEAFIQASTLARGVVVCCLSSILAIVL